MQNWIVFQSVVLENEEFHFEVSKKLKNTKNFIRAEELSFWEN